MHWTYLIILAACIVGTLPLELVLHTGVYRQWLRLLTVLVPVVLVFAVWDVAAVHADWWTYDPARTVGVSLPGRLPLEELLFFVVVPICAVLTFEAVRVRRPDWFTWDDVSVDDEVGA